MAKVGDLFPSKYLKSSDLQGKEFRVHIDRVVMEKIVDEEPEKACIYFQNSEQGMVLNKTNAMVLASAYGDETDNWRGQTAVLGTHKVQFQGKLVDGLTIRPDATQGQPAPAVQSQSPPSVAPPPADGPPAPLDDDLPF